MISRMAYRHNVRRLKQLAGLLSMLVIALISGCKGIPDEVIPPDTMAPLLADIYTADAIVEGQYYQFGDDSVKMRFRQAVFDKYGITSAQLDTSIGWYGRNLEIYKDIEDKTIEILEKRVAEGGMGERRLAAADLQDADSADLWTASPYIKIFPGTRTKVLTFSIDRDESWKPGDRYSWRFKSHNLYSTTPVSIAALYDDGSIDYYSDNLTTGTRRSAEVITDSTKIPAKIFGSWLITPNAGSAVYLDSLQLVRTRLNPDSYGLRWRQYHTAPTKPADADSSLSTVSMPYEGTLK